MPKLPDALAAFKILMANKTSAQGRVYREDFPQNWSYPCLLYFQENAIPHASNTVDAARIGLYAWGSTERQARTLAYEARDVLKPPATPTQGYVGTVGEVYFSGVTALTGPAWIPDPATGDARYVLSFLMHYARATQTA